MQCKLHKAFKFQKLEQALICAVFRAFRDSPVVSLFLRFSHRKNVDLFMCFLCPKGLKPLFVKWYTLLHIPHYCIVSAGGMKWGIAENYDWCKRNSLCLVLRNLLMTMDLWERDSTTPFRKKNEKNQICFSELKSALNWNFRWSSDRHTFFSKNPDKSTLCVYSNILLLKHFSQNAKQLKMSNKVQKTHTRYVTQSSFQKWVVI